MAKKAAKKAAVRRPTKKEIDEIIGDAAPPVPRKQAPRKKVKKPTAATPATKEVGAEALPPGHRLVRDVVIPPYPRELEDKRYGDKTPAVMDWYEKNHPKAFEALYANRITPRESLVG